MKLQSLNDLLIKELQDLYDAENRIIEALPKMAERPLRRSCAQA